MAKLPPYNIYTCGDHAVTLDFGNRIDKEVNRYVLFLFHLIKQKNIPGVVDVIPAYSSITVVYNICRVRSAAGNKSAIEFIKLQLEALTSLTGIAAEPKGKLVKIPACYEAAFAPDIEEVANEKKLSVKEVVEIHSSRTYHVFMLGFLPGFAYMGVIDDTIEVPRKNTPRLAVPEGSIGIAGLQTGIYPVESPGGWNIIAATPIKLFDIANYPPVLLQPGDEVQFYPVSTEEFNRIKSAL